MNRRASEDHQMTLDDYIKRVDEAARATLHVALKHRATEDTLASARVAMTAVTAEYNDALSRLRMATSALSNVATGNRACGCAFDHQNRPCAYPDHHDDFCA